MAIIVAIPLAWVAAIDPTVSMILLAASTVTTLIAVFAGLTVYADWRSKRAESFVLRLTDWGVEFNAPVRNSQLGGVRERGGAVPWDRMNEVRQAPWWFSARFGLLGVDFFPLGYHRGYPVLTVPAEGPWRVDVPWLLQVDAEKATQIAREQIALHPSIVPRTPVDRRARRSPV